MLRLRLLVLLGAIGSVALCAAATAPEAMAGLPGKSSHSCWWSSALCAEIANPQDFWGHWYVGHDEPAVLFYSNKPGSGNRMIYTVKIPTEPAGFPSDPFSLSKSYNFQLHPAFWFGLAMCDTQSYPEQVSYCPPDSNSNAVDVTTSTKHPGSAYMELQFYPPGWAPLPAGVSCDATKWCVAVVIWSLSEDPINGTTLNQGCQNQIFGGLEYGNFAFLTSSGRPQGPPNPLQWNPSTSGTPGPDALYMNPGDTVKVVLHDSPHGLITAVYDETTHQFGWMTASAANGFGQIKYAPDPSTDCTMIPYNFHPEYSTSTPQTTVPWAAHSYNVSFTDEIGHFDFCTVVDPSTGNCTGQEGPTGDQEPTEGGYPGDDYGCFSASDSLLYQTTGCTGTNTPGFDGVPYQLAWPDGSPNRPTPILFTSPRSDGRPYSQAAFEADLPRIEAADLGGHCNRSTGTNCYNPPPTDESVPPVFVPATFYPYYSTVQAGESHDRGPVGDRHRGGQGCMWGIGSTLPGTINNFGGNSTAEYGPLHGTWYYVFGGHGATTFRYNNYQQVLPNNPC